MMSCIFDAAAAGIQVTHAELVPAESGYLLSADFDIDFTSEIESALNKGVSLSFLVEFQLVSPRKYWFDDEITTVSRHIELSYHALSRQYLLKVAATSSLSPHWPRRRTSCHVCVTGRCWTSHRLKTASTTRPSCVSGWIPRACPKPCRWKPWAPRNGPWCRNDTAGPRRCSSISVNIHT